MKGSRFVRIATLSVVFFAGLSIAANRFPQNFVAGTGLSVTAVDNATTLHQDVAYSIANTGVSGSSCTNCNLSYNAQGQITAASNGSGGGVSSVSGGTNITCSPSTGAAICSVTGTLPPSLGGTGQGLLTNNELIVGQGSSAVAFVAAGASGQILTQPVSGAPAFANLDLSGTNTSFTNFLGHARGGTDVTSPGTTGNILTSNGTNWSSAAPGPPGTSAQVAEVTSGGSPPSLGGGLLVSLTSTVPTNGKIAVDADIECFSTSAINSIQYNANVDATTFALGHRFDVAVANSQSGGSIHWLTPALSAGSHTINFTASQSNTGASCGYSFRTEVLTN